MIGIRRIPLALMAAAACGGQPTVAQTPAPRDDGTAHAYMYEVPAQQPAPAPQQAQEAPFIEVSGSAIVSVAPDLARAAFAVESHAETAEAAAAQNATAMDGVLKALRAAGIQGLRVETFGYSLQPEYSYSEDGGVRVREVAGYTALNNVRATVPDVKAVGKAIDAAVKAGANRVASLTFEASDTEAAQHDALDQAVKSARAQAETIAAALGRRLGPALEVHGGSQPPSPRPMMYESQIRLRAAAPETPVEAADQQVSANVTIRFALGPAEGR